jgi:hypothetical protein
VPRSSLAYNYLLGWLCPFVGVFGLGALGRDFCICFGPGFPYIVEETVPKTTYKQNGTGGSRSHPHLVQVFQLCLVSTVIQGLS